MTRLLICGDREWKDMVFIQLMLKQRPDVTVVIEGECRGADKLARAAAEHLGIPVEPYPALWKEHGPAAGSIRNQQMLDEGRPTEVWAFHDNFEESKGTRDMTNRSVWANIPTWLITHYSMEMLSRLERR